MQDSQFLIFPENMSKQLRFYLYNYLSIPELIRLASTAKCQSENEQNKYFIEIWGFICQKVFGKQICEQEKYLKDPKKLFNERKALLVKSINEEFPSEEETIQKAILRFLITGIVPENYNIDLKKTIFIKIASKNFTVLSLEALKINFKYGILEESKGFKLGAYTFSNRGSRREPS